MNVGFYSSIRMPTHSSNLESDLRKSDRFITIPIFKMPELPSQPWPAPTRLSINSLAQPMARASSEFLPRNPPSRLELSTFLHCRRRSTSPVMIAPACSLRLLRVHPTLRAESLPIFPHPQTTVGRKLFISPYNHSPLFSLDFTPSCTAGAELRA